MNVVYTDVINILFSWEIKLILSIKIIYLGNVSLEKDLRSISTYFGVHRKNIDEWDAIIETLLESRKTREPRNQTLAIFSCS
jgi:hypothetical protein